jgi:hypothetical protein
MSGQGRTRRDCWADFGAEVIKVEYSRRMDIMRQAEKKGQAYNHHPRWLQMNRNKLSITLNPAPFVLDFATTVVTQGKIKVAQSMGRSLPVGWIVDAAGTASTRPEDFFAGGSLLHFGGHKGYALSLMTCLVGGLSGGFQAEQARLGGIFVQAIDVAAFEELETYMKNVRQFLNGIKSAPRTREDQEIVFPGERASRSRETRLRVDRDSMIIRERVKLP